MYIGLFIAPVAGVDAVFCRATWRIDRFLFHTQIGGSMSVILVPAFGEDIMINWWNWRPTVALLVRAGILPTGEREECCLANGCGGHLSETEALQAADYLETVVAKMQPSERLLSDGSTTNQPKNYTVPISEWGDNEIINHYSADYKLLKEFADFCRRSGGFDIL